ncbi:MAG: hypothetical protein DRH97_02570 [Chloroflexi bacterium]|nr:MAG: hypothetical protein DRH97_02570 [Chloroflexota bacterium]
MAKKKGSKKEPLLKVTEEEAVESKQEETEQTPFLEAIEEEAVELKTEEADFKLPVRKQKTSLTIAAPRASFIEKTSFDFTYKCYHKTPGHCKECYAKARK